MVVLVGIYFFCIFIIIGQTVKATADSAIFS